ncbi:fluoride efflux transporter FluC [Modestobacter versicolor]|uniref:fluoride efflux transporter FluC n=1 Tax=Modestobacter versicolor TaxID=429133 RepID=UPI0034DF23E8
MTPLLVVLGALAGAPLRLLADRVATARRGPGSVAGTLTVNVVGSAVLGVLLGLRGVSPAVVALVGTGFCGTLTTFSTYGADVVRLVEERAVGRAVVYLLGSVLLGTGTAAVGFLAVR